MESIVGCLINTDLAMVQYRGGTSTHKRESAKDFCGAAAIPMETTLSTLDLLKCLHGSIILFDV